VVAVGRGRATTATFSLSTKVGDTVLGEALAADHRRRHHVILREEEVLGVVEGVAEMAMA
jgi:co-chaperonin GroES (HSP10)